MKLNVDYSRVCKFRSSLKDRDTFKLVQGNIKHLYKNTLKIHYPITVLVPRLGIEFVDSNEVLCKRCKELDINKIFVLIERYSYKGKDITTLGYISKKSVTVPCSLCCLFATVRVKDAV